MNAVEPVASSLCPYSLVHTSAPPTLTCASLVAPRSHFLFDISGFALDSS